MLQAQEASVQTQESVCLEWKVKDYQESTGGREEGQMLEAIFRIRGHRTSFCRQWEPLILS